MNMRKKSFPLAPMSGAILILTLLLWLLPFVFLGYSLFSGQRITAVIAGGLLVLYGIVWVFCRPSCFELAGESMKIIFPAWSRTIPLKDIVNVRLMQRDGLKQEFGRALRVGAGGLWGGFGWLWTSKRGMVELYVSRLDGLIGLVAETIR